MRKGLKDNGIITSENGQVIGINLGWDFVSEHEWGIPEIRNAFGISDTVTRKSLGADVRLITNVPGGLLFLDFEDAVYLVYSDSLDPEWRKLVSAKEPSQDDLDRMLSFYEGETISTAWSESDFGIRVQKDPKDHLETHKMVLGQVYEAFLEKDIIIFLGGGENSFGNSGLVIAIRSRIPEDVLETMKKSDEDYLNLQDAVEEIERAVNLKKKLKDAGKKYYALSPHWRQDNNSSPTKHLVIFWLNPCEQRENNYGWFTVEELLEWIEGKGPIPKSMQKQEKE